MVEVAIMVKLWLKTLSTTYNASGAAAAARQGDVVMIVDVIDMSTTAEAALEAGAISVLGASPDHQLVPVTVNPEKIGYYAGKKAIKHDTGVIIAAEPRLINDEDERLSEIQQVLRGVDRAGAEVLRLCPILAGRWSSLRILQARFWLLSVLREAPPMMLPIIMGHRRLLPGPLPGPMKGMGTLQQRMQPEGP